MKQDNLLKVGNKCNNNCILCNYLNIKSDNGKTFDEIKNEILELKNNCIKELILPCNADIRKDFFEILSFAKDCGFSVILKTNGRFFFYSDYCMKIKDKVDKVIFYNYSDNEGSYEKYTKTAGSWKQSRIAIDNLTKFNIPFDLVNLSFCQDYFFIPDKPNEVVIEVTARCNLLCAFCFNKVAFAKNSRKNEEMTTEYVKKIIDNISACGIPKVRFSGGEALLRKDIFELMDYAKKKNLTVWLNTNATIIDERIATELEKYVEDVLISINGYDKETDSKWTCTDTFSKKIVGIKLLKKTKIPVVRASTVATKGNIDNLEKIYAIIKDLEMDYWEVYRPILSEKDGKVDSKVSLEFDIDKLSKKLAVLSFDFGKMIPIANAVPFCAFKPEIIDALGIGAMFDDGHSRLVVDPDRFIKPSYFINENLGSPIDLFSCWNSKFSKDMRNLKFIPVDCEGCRYLKKCKGGSRYMANLFFDSYSSEDPIAISRKYQFKKDVKN